MALPRSEASNWIPEPSKLGTECTSSRVVFLTTKQCAYLRASTLAIFPVFTGKYICCPLDKLDLAYVDFSIDKKPDGPRNSWISEMWLRFVLSLCLCTSGLTGLSGEHDD